VSEYIFAGLFAGVPSDLWDTEMLIPFGWWILPIAVFLLMAGVGAKRNDSIGMLSAYRHGTALNWWKNRFWGGFSSGMRKAVLMLSVVFVCDLVTGRPSAFFMKESIKIGVLWLLHIVSLDALFLLLDFVFNQRFILAALLLLEGVTFIMGYWIRAISHAMYGMWGMYLWSDWYETGGFPTASIIVVELILAAAGYCIGRIYLKKGGMRKLLGKEGF